jgi:hypothetical protein
MKAPACLHSRGNSRPFVPELVELGLDALNPTEAKAGLDPLKLKPGPGVSLTLQGGMNALLWNDLEAMDAVVCEPVPALKESGGFVLATDHSIPTHVSVPDRKHVLAVVREVGQYGIHRKKER